MWMQQRNIIKLSVLIRMNSRTSLYISGIFISVENFLSNSRFEGLSYQESLYKMNEECTEEFTKIVFSPPQKHPFPRFCQPPFKSENCPSPPF